jgi:hypothetical protein
MKREYYVLTIPKVDMKNTLDICIGKTTTQRYSNNKNKVIIKTSSKRIKKKLTKGFKRDDILPAKFMTKLSYKEVLELMNTEEWLNKNK